MNAYRKYNIPCFTLLFEKGILDNGMIGHKTDEVFATDTGQFFFDTKLNFIPGNFVNKQRHGEERLAITQAIGILQANIKHISSNNQPLKFEGGDIRQAPGRKLFFVGYGHRNDPSAAQSIHNLIGEQFIVVPIELLQPRYYHLDCCFLPLFHDFALVYEGEYQTNKQGDRIIEKSDPNDPTSLEWPALIHETATMTISSRKRIRQLYDADHLILITEKEAAAFGANAVLVTNEARQDIMFIPAHSLTLSTINQIKQKIHGIAIEEVEFDAFHRSGGSIRCATQEVPCSTTFVASLKKQSATDDVFNHTLFFHSAKSARSNSTRKINIDDYQVHYRSKPY